MKKPTLKDIAKAAGVSTATVSYILNNVQNQTIPEETRARVLEQVKRLGYVPNLAARSLVRQQSGLIGILVNRKHEETSWAKMRHFRFIDELEAKLSKLGYHVILHSIEAAQPKLDIIAERKLDAVIVIEPLTHQFHKISRHFPQGVPVIIVDSCINDPLFNQITFDFEQVKSQLEMNNVELDQCYFIVDHYNDANMIQHIHSHFPIPIHVMKNEQQLEQFITKHYQKHGIIMNEAIAMISLNYVPSHMMTVVCTIGISELLPPGIKKIKLENKAEQVMDVLMKLLKENNNQSKIE